MLRLLLLSEHTGSDRPRWPLAGCCTALLETQHWPQLGNTTWLITREKSPCDASPSRGLCLQAWFLQRCAQRLSAEPANHARAGAALLHPLLGAPGRNAKCWEQKQRGSTGAPTSRWLLMAESSAGPTGGLCHLLLQLVTVGTPLLKSTEQKSIRIRFYFPSDLCRQGHFGSPAVH